MTATTGMQPAPCYAERMNGPVHHNPAPEKPTPPGQSLAAPLDFGGPAILGLLLLCAALVLVAAARCP